MANLNECIEFVETNMKYYSMRPGYKPMYDRYSSIYAFLVELKERREGDNNAFVSGYKMGVTSLQEALAKKFSEEIEDSILNGDKKTDYDFQRDYRGQFKKGGSE